MRTPSAVCSCAVIARAASRSQRPACSARPALVSEQATGTAAAASPGDPGAAGRRREVASRKLPEGVALIERSGLVRDWLELAARCECPDLGQCPLFDEPPLAPRDGGGRRPPPRPRLSAGSRFGGGPFVQGEDRRQAPGGRRRGCVI